MTTPRKGKRTDKGWARVFEKYDLDPSSDLLFISADKLNAVRNEGHAPDARNMVKFDTREQMPAFLREHGYFVVPVTNGQYALIRGDGFADLPERNKSAAPIKHSCKSLPPQLPGKKSSEAIQLAKALNSGLLERHFGIPELQNAFSGKQRSGSFEFEVGPVGPIRAKGVQIEIDGGYLNSAGTQGVIIEAKVGEPANLLTRQLYYPMRDLTTAHPRITFRTAFMACPDEDTFIFWDVRFPDVNQYRSAVVSKPRTYCLEVQPLSIAHKILQSLGSAGSAQSSDVANAPSQANDVEKIMRVPQLILEGKTTGEQVARAIGFDKRQGNYYKRAAATLGLLTPNTKAVTSLGRVFASASSKHKEMLIIHQMMRDPVLSHVFASLDHYLPKGAVTLSDIEKIIVDFAGPVSGSTVRRRAQCAMAWLGWIGERNRHWRRTKHGLVLEDSLL